MIKKLFLVLMFATVLFADIIKVQNFEADLFSKRDSTLKKIELSLMFEGRDIENKREPIVDALNIIVSSFYIEELFTSKGKEKFKKSLIAYVSKKYDIEIEHIFIKKMILKESVGVKEFIKALKKEGYIKKNNI